jgi:RimJ/RimL family protein N-acetyltransferase
LSNKPSKIDDLTALHLESLYVGAGRGRISAINQWDGGRVPRLHLCRSATSAQWRLRADISPDLSDRLTGLLARETPADVVPRPPVHRAEYDELLRPVSEHREGLAFAATEPPTIGATAVPVDTANAFLLEPLMSDWLSDVPHRSPFMTVVVNGAAVAVCASVRITEAAHQAGVEVHLAHRRKGHGRTVVAAWARAVHSLGARPLYSTTRDNEASRRLAESLGFVPFASDYVLY